MEGSSSTRRTVPQEENKRRLKGQGQEQRQQKKETHRHIGWRIVAVRAEYDFMVLSDLSHVYVLADLLISKPYQQEEFDIRKHFES